MNINDPENLKLNIETEMSNSSKAYALFYSFFLIPLMIAVFGALFFFLFQMLTYESQNPYDLLNNIKSGSLTKRWQSAYELSNLMSDVENIPEDPMFANQIALMYEKAVYDDPRVRTYLALAMGQTQNNKFCESLNIGINDAGLNNRIAAIKSIGMIKCSDLVNTLNDLIISDDDNQIRLAAIISSGQILDISSIKYLQMTLEDEEPNIRWDSALSLAKFGNNAGYNVLKNLLSRDYYKNYPEVDVREVENTILTVLAMVSDIKTRDFKEELNLLAETEKNIKIREFAMKILHEYY